MNSEIHTAAAKACCRGQVGTSYAQCRLKLIVPPVNLCLLVDVTFESRTQHKSQSLKKKTKELGQE